MVGGEDDGRGGWWEGRVMGGEDGGRGGWSEGIASVSVLC